MVMRNEHRPNEIKLYELEMAAAARRKLDDNIEQAIIELWRIGTSVTAIASAAGLHRASIHRVIALNQGRRPGATKG